MPPHSTTHRTLVGLTARPFDRRRRLAAFMSRHVHQDSKVSRRDSCFAFLCVLQPARASSTAVRFKFVSPSSGLICCNLQQRPDSSAKLLRQSSEQYLDIVASARPSGQEDFQRGTLPVSLASCSISPFLKSLYYHGVIHKRPRDRQHGDINPDPPVTAQLQHAIIWKPYGLVPFFGYTSYHIEPSCKQMYGHLKGKTYPHLRPKS